MAQSSDDQDETPVELDFDLGDDDGECDPIPVQPIDPTGPNDDNDFARVAGAAKFRVKLQRAVSVNVVKESVSARYLRPPIRIPLDQQFGDFTIDVVQDPDAPSDPTRLIITVTGERNVVTRNMIVMLLKIPRQGSDTKIQVGLAAGKLYKL